MLTVLITHKELKNRVGESFYSFIGYICDTDYGDGFANVYLFQTHQTVYIKYVQLFTLQLYFSDFLHIHNSVTSQTL